MDAQGMAAPEAGEAYMRAHALCQQVEEAPQHFQVLRGLWEILLHQKCPRAHLILKMAEALRGTLKSQPHGPSQSKATSQGGGLLV
jgi:hypothetical protein